MSTVEEKNSRVMEVLLSAISPLQLLWGKILGQGAVGPLQRLCLTDLVDRRTDRRHDRRDHEISDQKVHHKQRDP